MAAKQIDELKQHIAELNNQIVGLKSKQEDDTAEIEQYQSELSECRQTVTAREAQIKELNHSVATADSDRKATSEVHERTLDDYKQQLEQHRVAHEKLHAEIQHHRERAVDHDATLQRVYYDLSHAQAALSAKDEERDELVAQKLGVELSLQEMRAEWEQDRAKLDELEALRHDMEALQAQQSSYMADQERLADMRQGYERILLIKDERIAHLEAQIQKALVRNMRAAEAADDANVAAATSLDDDAPPLLSIHGETLQAELADDYDEDEYPYEPEPLHQSPITATSTEPKEPSAPAVHRALSDITATFSFAPSEAPKLTLYVQESASVSPADLATVALAQHIQEVASVASVDAAPQKLRVSISEVGSTAPAQRSITVSSASIQTDAHELCIAMLPAGSFAISPITPLTVATCTLGTQTHAPLLTSGVVETASIALYPSVPASQNAIAPVMATHEEAPIVHDTTKTSTFSTGVQTTEVLNERAETTPNKVGFLQWFLPMVAIIFGAWLHFYTELSELHSWRTANGRYYGHAYHLGGAYGNGRYLFNMIPIAMSGSGWFSKSMSRAIIMLEGLARTSHTPHY
ncbi:hypothetical protein BDU57DRAFT_208153 [Ampelomyces quisqualis]|uniref:Uncharacterized protein n=1 Tax=Ampelomyces quisqualis TaxID=50730 RepID=A0A6A5QK90_AMPQU|nr:hypothetical protein BDU57DRAFT_208153 [Ampelomyces quisqualis]